MAAHSHAHHHHRDGSHGHSHGHSGGGHARAPAKNRWLYVSLALTLSFAVVEALGGWWAGSLALLGDAGHMFSDSMALGLSAFAAWIARRPPSLRHSYGFARAEIVAALVNGLLMLLVVAGIAFEALQRFKTPAPVAGKTVMLIAAGGLAVNILVFALLMRGGASLNVRAALVHVVGDMLGSLAALVAGAAIFFTGWTPIDPLLSLFICLLIVYSTYHLLREAINILMEGVPFNLSLELVGHSMAAIDGVASIHDLHVWALASGKFALSAHVVLNDVAHWPLVLSRLRTMLHERFTIDHVTLQPELAAPPPLPYTDVIPIHPHLTRDDHRH